MKSLAEYLTEHLAGIKHWRGDKSLQYDRIEDVVKRYPSIKGQFEVREHDGEIEEIYLYFQSKYANNGSKNSLTSNNEFSDIHYQHYCYDMEDFELAAHDHEYGSENNATLFSETNKINLEFKKTVLTKYKNKGILFTVNSRHQYTPDFSSTFFPIKLDKPAYFSSNKGILSIPLDHDNAMDFEEVQNLNASRVPNQYLVSTLIDHVFTELKDVIGRSHVKSVNIYTPDFKEWIFPSKYVDCYELGNYLVFAINQ